MSRNLWMTKAKRFGWQRAEQRSALAWKDAGGTSASFVDLLC